MTWLGVLVSGHGEFATDLAIRAFEKEGVVCNPGKTFKVPFIRDMDSPSCLSFPPVRVDPHEGTSGQADSCTPTFFDEIS